MSIFSDIHDEATVKDLKKAILKGKSRKNKDVDWYIRDVIYPLYLNVVYEDSNEVTDYIKSIK